MNICLRWASRAKAVARDCMWTEWRIFLIGILLLSVGCDLRRIGPPIPRLFGKEYLEEHGYGTNVINALLEYQKIDHETVIKLLELPNADVREMLGPNAYLTRNERDILWQDKSERVRYAVATNPSLTSDEVLLAMKDTSSMVWHGLAMNPFVPKNVLITLRYKRSVSLSAFAQNPNCPDVIVEEIERSGNSVQKKLLEFGRVQKKKGYYLGQPIMAPLQ